MLKLIGAIIGTFFLFILVFPMAGILATLVLKILLPYLLGPVVIAAVLGQFMVWSDALGSVLILGAGWIVLLRMARATIMRKETSFVWHEGHYSAALLVLSLGIPYWGGKSAAGEEDLAGEAEGAQ